MFSQVSVRSQGGYPSPMFFPRSLVPGPFRGGGGGGGTPVLVGAGGDTICIGPFLNIILNPNCYLLRTKYTRSMSFAKDFEALMKEGKWDSKFLCSTYNSFLPHV